MRELGSRGDWEGKLWHQADRGDLRRSGSDPETIRTLLSELESSTPATADQFAASATAALVRADFDAAEHRLRSGLFLAPSSLPLRNDLGIVLFNRWKRQGHLLDALQALDFLARAHQAPRAFENLALLESSLFGQAVNSAGRSARPATDPQELEESLESAVLAHLSRPNFRSEASTLARLRRDAEMHKSATGDPFWRDLLDDALGSSGEDSATTSLTQRLERGRSLRLENRFSEAIRELGAGLDLCDSLQRPLCALSAYYYANCLSRPQPKTAESRFRELQSHAQQRGWKSIDGRSRWMLARLAGFAGRRIDALHERLHALELFEQLGYQDYRVRLRNMLADDLAAIGDVHGELRERGLALASSAQLRATTRIEVLGAVGDTAEALGLLHAARRIAAIQSEILPADAEDSFQIEILLTQARIDSRLGANASSERELTSAEALVRSHDDPAWLKTLEARIELVRLANSNASDSTPIDPARFDRLRSVLSGLGLPALSLEVDLLQVEQAVMRKNWAVAADAIDRLRAHSDRTRTEAIKRGDYFDEARLSDLHKQLALGRAASPHQLCSELRTTFSTVSPDTTSNPCSRPPGPGVAELTYFAAGHELFVLVRSSGGSRFEKLKLTRDRLEEILFQVNSPGLRGVSELNQQVEESLLLLHHVLVESAIGTAGATDALWIVADAAFENVPFARLREKPGSPRLVERFELRFSQSLELTEEDAPFVASDHALLVGDPEFDQSVFAGFPRLPAAQREVRSLAKRFPTHTVLIGRAASELAMAELLPRSTLVHFAGHALTDVLDPYESSLLLAPAADRDGRWTAREAAQENLEHVRLIVLASCRAGAVNRIGIGSSRALARVLLEAGAQAVLTSNIDLVDRDTEVFFEQFYMQLENLGDASRALVATQRYFAANPSLLAGGEVVWGSFRLTNAGF